MREYHPNTNPGKKKKKRRRRRSYSVIQPLKVDTKVLIGNGILFSPKIRNKESHTNYFDSSLLEVTNNEFLTR